MNEPSSKLRHQGLFPSGTTAIVGDSIINGVTEERTTRKIGLLKYAIFQELQWQI